MAQASDEERAHFAAIGAVEAAAEDDQIARALEVPPGERMLEGLRLGAQIELTPAHLAEIDARTDGQMELARLRVARGLD